jgi:hypothetical protein
MTDPDRLHITPIGHALITPEEMGQEDYASFCEAASLPQTAEGYGMVLAEDQDGNHWTFMGDVAYTQMMAESTQHGPMRLDMDRNTARTMFPYHRPGWPDEW